MTADESRVPENLDSFARRLARRRRSLRRRFRRWIGSSQSASTVVVVVILIVVAILVGIVISQRGLSFPGRKSSLELASISGLALPVAPRVRSC